MATKIPGSTKRGHSAGTTRQKPTGLNRLFGNAVPMETGGSKSQSRGYSSSGKKGC